MISRKTLAIVGAGPGLGLSVAKRFGQDGFRVALIARNSERLDSYVRELRELDVESVGLTADVLDPQQLVRAFAQIKEVFGPVDVLEFSPYPSPFVHVLETTADKALRLFQLCVLAPIICVEQVLPDMLKKGNGALLFTTGTSAVIPMPALANVGIATSGLRNYVYCLNEVLAPKGIYAGTICIGVRVEKGGEGDPDKIAALYYDMHEKRDRVEELIGIGSQRRG